MKNRLAVSLSLVLVLSIATCTFAGDKAKCKKGAKTPAGKHKVEKIDKEFAKKYGLDPEFYKKHTLAEGIEIVTSDVVADYAHLEAAFLIETMVKNLSDASKKQVRDAGALCILMGHSENASDIPEFKTDKTGKELEYYNWRTRGMVTRKHNRPTLTCGEEDLMEYEGGMELESIFIHEFAHMIDSVGLSQEQEEKLVEAYKNAKEKGLWEDGRAAQRFRRVKGKKKVNLLDALCKSFPDFPRETFVKVFEGGRILVNGEKAKSDVKVNKEDKVIIWYGGPKTCYAGKNRAEYWAEGVQSWYDNNRTNDHDHNHINRREQLIKYDPELAKLCEEVFGSDAWRFVSPRKRGGQGHLKDFDPKKAPKFTEPKSIKKAANDYYDKYWKEHRDKLKEEFSK